MDMYNEKDDFKNKFIKRLIKYSVDITFFTNEIRSTKIPWSISDQLIRSATSIGANVVEAKSSSSRKDYIKFFEIALKSANETKYWLIVIDECLKGSNDKIKQLYKEVDEISKILGSSILTLKNKK